MTVQLSDTDTAGGLLTIDLAALRANYRTLVRLAAPATCGAVVKADAYGLGAARVAPVLAGAGCRDFFVAHLREGLALRPHLPHDAVITILNGLQPNGEEACAECGLVPVLNGLEQVEAWAALARRLSRRLPAALQVDSGMTRLGLSAAEVERVAEHDLLGTLDVRLVMSHLACADEPAHPANAAQRDAFNGLLRQLPKTRVSFANSGGILLGEGFVHDLARPGLALYGVNPIPEQSVALRPVVRLDARVIQVRSVPKNTAIGYGAAFTSTRPMRLATIAVGYADGWPRHLSDKGAAFAGDVSLPIVGRVSMDSTIIDISALSDDALHLGSLVELIGPHQTLDDVAAKAGTIPYEILTGLGRRYARHYLDHEAEAPASMKGGVAP